MPDRRTTRHRVALVLAAAILAASSGMASVTAQSTSAGSGDAVSGDGGSGETPALPKGKAGGVAGTGLGGTSRDGATKGETAISGDLSMSGTGMSVPGPAGSGVSPNDMFDGGSQNVSRKP